MTMGKQKEPPIDPGRLRALMQSREWKAADLARALDCGEDVVSKWLKQGRTPTGYTIARLAELFDCDAADLFGIEHAPDTMGRRARAAFARIPMPDRPRALQLLESFAAPREPELPLPTRAPAPIIPLRAAVASPPEPPELVEVPMFRIAATVGGIEAVTDGDEHVLVSQTLLSAHHLTPAKCFVLRVQGESMSGDDIHDGDIVLVKRLASPVSYTKNAICAVLDRRDETVTLKRIHRSRSGVATLTPSNPTMEPYTVPVDDAVPQGEFVAVVERGTAPKKPKGKRR